MLSLLKNIRVKFGKAADQLAAAQSFELPVKKISEPVVGWLAESDYILLTPKTDAINITDFSSPNQASPPLLSIPRVVSNPLGESAEAVTKDALPNLDISGRNRVSIDFQESLRYSTNDRSFIRTPQTISDNFNFAFATPEPTHTDAFLSLPLGCTAVSDDFHKPLGNPASAGGKQYADELEKAELEPRLQFDEKTPALIYPPDETTGLTTNKRKIEGISIWDLLLPILQRPINLNFGTVIDLPSNLYGYQTKGVEFLLENEAVLLGDDMGTGKTVQTAVAIRILFQAGKIRTALIVCPLSVIPNWSRELAKWAGNLAVTVVRGDREGRKIGWRQPAHVWLTTYETLRNDLEDVLTLRKGGFDLIAVDEAQRIKARNAGVSKAVRELRATRRWGLTGTPLENHLEDVFSIFEFIKPGLFEAARYWPHEVQAKIKPYFLRRRKADVLPDLPPLVQNPVWLRLEDAQRKSYDEFEKNGVLELHAKGESMTAQNIIVLINKLKQICNRCPLSGESSKLVWLREQMEVIAAEGDKALIFSQYKVERLPGTEWLEKELADFGALNYSNATSDSKRRAMLSAFRDDPEKKVFLGHPKTAGLGLNELVAANYVIHFDHWWNPAVMNQATARAHRPGQTKTVFAYDLWVEDTYEKIISALLEQKQNLYNEVIDSASAPREQETSLAFAVADKLFEKYGLKSARRPVALKLETKAPNPDQQDKPAPQMTMETFKILARDDQADESNKRAGIPSKVRREVWRRDEGKCVKCGNRKNLEYDHIVPVSKGGSNTARNIELLCQDCNRAKSDLIQ